MSTNQKPPLWQHQSDTINLLKNEERVYDGSDPGTGKTRAALEAIDYRGSKAVLIIAPKTLVESAWAEDISQWTPGLSYSISLAANRSEGFSHDADIYITNTDATKWLAKQSKTFFEAFDSLIIDELHYFKHRTSQRSKALQKIAPYFKYRHGLSGTPNSNSIVDLWHQYMVLDDGARLGTNFYQFRSSVCVPTQVGPAAQHVRWDDRPGAELAVAGLVQDITIRHSFQECMDIPDNQLRYVTYHPSSKLMDMYEEMATHAILTLKNEDITAVHAASLRTKLLQIASGAVYSNNQGDYKVLDTERYELVIDLIEEHPHSVTFYIWNHQRDQLVAAANRRNIKHAIIDGSTPDGKREEIRKAYQAGDFQTIFLHPKTGSHGLTLTKGTRTIWPSPVYQADFLKQGRHRIYRGGQTQKTETIMVEALGTVERKVFEILNHKTANMVNFLEMLEDK